MRARLSRRNTTPFEVGVGPESSARAAAEKEADGRSAGTRRLGARKGPGEPSTLLATDQRWTGACLAATTRLPLRLGRLDVLLRRFASVLFVVKLCDKTIHCPALGPRSYYLLITSRAQPIILTTSPCLYADVSSLTLSTALKLGTSHRGKMAPPIKEEQALPEGNTAPSSLPENPKTPTRQASVSTPLSAAGLARARAAATDTSADAAQCTNDHTNGSRKRRHSEVDTGAQQGIPEVRQANEQEAAEQGEAANMSPRAGDTLDTETKGTVFLDFKPLWLSARKAALDKLMPSGAAASSNSQPPPLAASSTAHQVQPPKDFIIAERQFLRTVCAFLKSRSAMLTAKSAERLPVDGDRTVACCTACDPAPPDNMGSSFSLHPYLCTEQVQWFLHLLDFLSCATALRHFIEDLSLANEFYVSLWGYTPRSLSTDRRIIGIKSKRKIHTEPQDKTQATSLKSWWATRRDRKIADKDNPSVSYIFFGLFQVDGTPISWV